MSFKLLKKRDHSSTSQGSRISKELNKSKAKRQKRAPLLEVDCCDSAMSSFHEDASYISDTYMSGAFTPFSTYSTSSKLTGISGRSRRKSKESRKSLKIYSQRERGQTFKGGHLLRSLTFHQKLINSNLQKDQFKFDTPLPKKKQQSRVDFLEPVSECESESTQYCSQNFIENPHQYSNSTQAKFLSIKGGQSSETGHKANLTKAAPKTQQLKAKKFKIPPSTKVFYEDSLTGIQRAFSIFNEQDIKYLQNKVLKPMAEKKLGNEDDNASDEECVKNAKDMLKDSIFAVINEHLSKKKSNHSKSGSNVSSDEESDEI